MKSKLAIWSWILPIITVIFYIIAIGILAMRPDAGLGSPIKPEERSLSIFFSLIFLLITITGFIFGIVGLRAKNPNISGKGHAIVGIILNVILFFYGLLLFGSSLIGG